jgi:hypothetical protein
MACLMSGVVVSRRGGCLRSVLRILAPLTVLGLSSVVTVLLRSAVSVLLSAVPVLRGALSVLLWWWLLRRLPVLLRRSLSRAERVQALGRSELKRCRALPIARTLRCEAPLRLTLRRRSAPTLLR